MLFTDRIELAVLRTALWPMMSTVDVLYMLQCSQRTYRLLSLYRVQDDMKMHCLLQYRHDHHPLVTELDLHDFDRRAYDRLVAVAPVHIHVKSMTASSDISQVALPSIPSLQRLTLDLGNVDEYSAAVIAMTLQRNPQVRVLRLSFYGLSQDVASTMAAGLQYLRVLEELDLHPHQNSAIFLVRVLQDHHSIKTIRIKDAIISDENAQALAIAFTQCISLQQVYFESLHISSNAVKALATSLLQNNTILQRFTLSSIEDIDDGILDDGIIVLVVAALHHNNTLLELDLSNNEVSGDGVEALATLLQHNSTLQILCLHNCELGPTVSSLAAALHHNNTLQQLILTGIHLRDDDALALSEALTHNKSLHTLHLDNTRITIAGMRHIAKSLKYNKSLTALNLGENHFGDTGVKAIAIALEHNTTLTQLHLQQTDIGDSGVQALATLLQHNTALQHLNLQAIRMSAAAVRVLGTALSHHNHSLRILDLNYIRMKDEHAMTLVETLQHNSTLQEVRLARSNFSSNVVQLLRRTRRIIYTER